MNRIVAAIEKQKQNLRDRVEKGLTTVAALETTRRVLDIDAQEFGFQEVKTLAFAHGKLTLEEAQSIYAHLGTTPHHFNREPVEVKAVLTEVFRELLRWRIALSA